MLTYAWPDSIQAALALYWLAIAQTDLAGWLSDQGRSSHAGPPLDEAVDTLKSLGAAPALARAHY